jgi:hypothetical protein
VVRVLYLVPRETFETKMSRVRFDQVEAIGKIAEVRWSGPGWPSWNAKLAVHDNAERQVVAHKADVVLSYDLEGFRSLPVPLVVSYNEAFDVERVSTFVADNRVRLVVFHHANDLVRYPWWTAKGILRVHVPHSATESVYRDYGLEKDIDVLVAGNLNRWYYPVRCRLRDIVWKILRKRGYRVVVLHHPGYFLPPAPGSYVRQEFAQMLNRAKLVVTCAMRYHYALAKFAEIGLCRSLAVSDIPDEREDHFRSTTLWIESAMLDREIVDRMEELLDDADRLRRQTDQALERTQQTSTMAQYAERFVAAAMLAVKAGPR